MWLPFTPPPQSSAMYSRCVPSGQISRTREPFPALEMDQRFDCEVES